MFSTYVPSHKSSIINHTTYNMTLGISVLMYYYDYEFMNYDYLPKNNYDALAGARKKTKYLGRYFALILYLLFI